MRVGMRVRMDITRLTEAQLSHAAFCGQITYAQWDAEEARRKDEEENQRLRDWVAEISRRLAAHDANLRGGR